MRDISKQGGGLQYAVAQRGGISKIRSLSARNQSDIEISVTFNDSGVKWFYSLVFAQNGHGNHEIYVKKELIKKNETELLCRPTGADKADPELLTQTHLEQITTNKEFREISRFFKGGRHSHCRKCVFQFYFIIIAELWHSCQNIAFFGIGKRIL